MVRDPNRRRFPLADRYIEVIDDKLTGEVLLDEALKMMKQSERMSVGTWIDLMSGQSLRSPLLVLVLHTAARAETPRALRRHSRVHVLGELTRVVYRAQARHGTS